MGAPKGSLALDGPRALAAAALTYATLLMWLGLLHLNTLAVIAALACLPHPAAAATLALLAAACVLPVDRPFAPWQKRLARHISDTAHAYFPISMHCEDSATFDGTEKFVIGLEPHSVLPIATIAFHHGSPVLPAALEARPRACLASSVVFRVPLVKHLWSWLGLQSVDRRNMRRLLDEDHVVMLIPGGVQECLHLEQGQETIFLKSRFGFVKMALQSGAHLLPAFAFGQSRTYAYARPGPPLLPASTPRVLAKLFGFAPLLFWGRLGTPIPFAVPVHVVMGRPIRVQQVAEPSDEQVAALLATFIAEMSALFERHKAAAGYPSLTLRVL